MQTRTGLTDLQIRNREPHCEEIFPCEGRCFVPALRIVGARSVAVGNVVREHGTPESLPRSKAKGNAHVHQENMFMLDRLLSEQPQHRH